MKETPYIWYEGEIHSIGNQRLGIRRATLRSLDLLFILNYREINDDDSIITMTVAAKKMLMISKSPGFLQAYMKTKGFHQSPVNYKKAFQFIYNFKIRHG